MKYSLIRITKQLLQPIQFTREKLLGKTFSLDYISVANVVFFFFKCAVRDNRNIIQLKHKSHGLMGPAAGRGEDGVDTAALSIGHRGKAS